MFLITASVVRRIDEFTFLEGTTPNAIVLTFYQPSRAEMLPYMAAAPPPKQMAKTKDKDKGKEKAAPLAAQSSKFLDQFAFKAAVRPAGEEDIEDSQMDGIDSDS